MSGGRLIYLGGNGHSAVRLAAARAVAPFEILEAPYPGFEGRARAATFDAFLDAIAACGTGDLVYATGIGGLIALCLRARGQWLDLPLLLQAPVLWGLERRLMPRVMRSMPESFFHRITGSRWFQKRFARTRFEKPLTPEFQRAFFDGFARCTAGGDFFAWLTPALLRRLERDFAQRPDALTNISVWWGVRDRVVPLEELRWTGRALGVSWPLTTFARWNHYPMIDAPEEWVKELTHVLAAAGDVPRSGGAEAP